MTNNLCGNYSYPQQQTSNPNAVNINIYTPQAFGQSTCTSPIGNGQNSNFYSLYGNNTQPGVLYYPQNYNNPIGQPINYNYSGMQQYNQYQTASYPQQQPMYPQNQGTNGNNKGLERPEDKGEYPVKQQDSNLANKNNMLNNSNTVEKTDQEETENMLDKNKETTESDKKKKTKKKTIVSLTDDYIKTLENYLNDSNPKVRLIAAKEILERFKEDDSRKDNPCLIPLLNKMLKDTSASVRFLGLTTLQLGYSVGNEDTVEILKKIESENKNKIGQDQLLASEILLKMSAPLPIEIGEEQS